MMRKDRGNGILLVMMLITLMALMTFGAAYSIVELGKNSARSGLASRSRYVARAGLEAVMNELGTDDTYKGNSPGSRHVDTLYGSPSLSYEVTITNNGAGVTSVMAPDGRTVDPGTVYLASVGKDSVSSTVVGVSAMAGVAYKTRPNFASGAYASGYLSLEDAEADAWDSVKNGSYSSRSGAFTSVPPSDRKATVGGGAMAPDTITLKGAAKLDGQAVEGPDGAALTTAMTPATTIATTAKVAITPNVAPDVYGTQVPKFKPPFASSMVASGVVVAPPPPPSPPAVPPSPAPVTLSPGAYRFLKVTPGLKVVLKSGVYYFEDYVELANAELELNLNSSKDPVVVFIGKEARILAGSKVNDKGETSDLQLCFTDGITETSVTSFEADMNTLWDPTTAAAIAAARFPATATEVEYSKMVVDDSDMVAAVAGLGLVADLRNKADFYGAVMGSDVRVRGSGTELHQDLSLKGAKLTTGGDWNLGGVHEVKK